MSVVAAVVVVAAATVAAVCIIAREHARSRRGQEQLKTLLFRARAMLHSV